MMKFSFDMTPHSSNGRSEGHSAKRPSPVKTKGVYEKEANPAPARAMKTWGQELLGAAPGVTPVDEAIIVRMRGAVQSIIFMNTIKNTYQPLSRSITSSRRSLMIAHLW